jgi:hypothetical protein
MFRDFDPSYDPAVPVPFPVNKGLKRARTQLSRNHYVWLMALQ